MRFSLLVATVGRTLELDRLLQSLTRQIHRDFEVLVIDQNDDDRLAPIIARYRDTLEVHHLRSRRGLSRARNVGWDAATGDVVAFTDDDCILQPSLLADVEARLEDHPEVGALTGRAVDLCARPTAGRFRRAPGAVNRRTVWTSAVEVSIFVRTAAGDVRFDETLGLGSGTPWGSGEGTDLLLRLLDRGVQVRYDPTLTVTHAPLDGESDNDRIAKAYSYGCGMGRVLRQHRYPWPQRLIWIARPLAALLLAALRRQRNERTYRWRVFRGRLRGVLAA